MHRIRSLSLVCGVAIVIACGADPVAPTSIGLDTPASPSQTGCARTSVGLTPLTDLRSGGYQGQPGYLYPSERNDIPPAHLAAGLELARAVGPLDAEGQPSASASARYAFISIGMSNTTQEFSTFVNLANADSQRHPRLAVLDGAQSGMTAADWMNPGCACWSVLDSRIRQEGLTSRQVATAWIKLADRQPSSGWPAYARTLKDETIVVLQMLRTRFPNLRLAYLSSRIYAGYATSTLNPEPYAYESAFSVRWVIADQLNGSGGLAFDHSGPAPWVAWGPYLWADGLRPRSDGLTWSCSDLQADGTHPSGSGRQKAAQRLLEFVRSDATAREWYLGR